MGKSEEKHTVFNLLLDYSSRHRLLLLNAVMTNLITRVAYLIPLLLFGYGIDAIFLGQGELPLWILPAGLVPETELGQAYAIGGIILLSFLLGSVAHWMRDYSWFIFAQSVVHEVRTETYGTLQAAGMSYFEEQQTGNVMSILNNDINNLQGFFNDGLKNLFVLIAVLLVSVVTLLAINWQLALISLSITPVIMGIAYKLVQILQPRYDRVRSTLGQLNSRLQNNISGIRIIKTRGTESHEYERLKNSSRQFFDSKKEAMSLQYKFSPAIQTIMGAGLALTFVVGASWVLDQQLLWLRAESVTPGEFVIFALVLRQTINPLSQFGHIVQNYQQANSSIKRINSILEREDIKETDNRSELVVTDGRVSFDSVTFSYSHDGSVLKDVSFEAEGGDTVAIVGPTGAGKSTILKLLLRFYDPELGSVVIDGQEISDCSLRSLRDAVGYVSQEVFLFDQTVRENIRYGNFDRSDEEIQAAAKSAQAHSFITNLPDGYDTKIGEQGTKLSGGQRQRISIARAIISDPEILLLDEATSNVDTETELLIQRSLSELSEQRTTFVIAHRLSTVKDADLILVVEDGQVTEQGTHKELIDKRGLYANLWHIQSGNVDELPPEFVREVRTRRSQIDSK